MNCRTVLLHLDCLLDEQRSASAAELLRHVESCDSCQQALEQMRQFDRKFSSALLSAPVPAGLESRLMAALDAAELAQTNSSRRFVPRRLWRFAAGAACLFILAALAWLSAGKLHSLSYSTTLVRLAEQFPRPDRDAWEQLPMFDGNFSIESGDRSLRRFQLSGPKGLDLGGDERQDAAVFLFTQQAWSGLLILLPTDRFRGAPREAWPVRLPGRPMIQWQSADGLMTILCIVQQGPVEDLAQELYSDWT